MNNGGSPNYLLMNFHFPNARGAIEDADTEVTGFADL